MGAGLARRLWRSPHPGAVLVRLLLLPLAALHRVGTRARNAAYDLGMLRSRALPVPSIGVGNLSVGGTGKTPLAAHLARELAARGCRPGIVLRGYGSDEVAEHAAAVPEAVVVADPDRLAAARRAVDGGAQVLVLDDCLQRRDVRVDSMLATVAAETWARIRWPLPAGPWREGVGALGRADAVVVTCKTATAGAATALGERIRGRTRSGSAIVADIGPVGLRELGGEAQEPVRALSGRGVTAVCGIAEPELFAAQLAAAGARVTLKAWKDHHPYNAGDVAAIIDDVAADGTVVTTAKDAVKLAPLWPPGGPRCLVAVPGVTITFGAEALGAILDRIADIAGCGKNAMPQQPARPT